MKEYDIFIPLYYNDGTPIQSAKLQRLQFAQEEILIIEREIGIL